MKPPRPRSHEIVIRVAYAGVNRADLLQREGRYPPPEQGVPGLELSGTVMAVGSGVSDWREGDAVCAVVHEGAFAKYCVVPAAQALPVPKRVSPEEAATLPEALFTAWLALKIKARLRTGEWVLWHRGASGIGVLAVQLAAALGGRVIATVGGPEKKAALENLCGSARVIDYRREEMTEAVLEATGGRGVDVLIDIVGGTECNRNLRLLARGGRMVSLGFLQGGEVTIGAGRLLTRELTWSGTTLRTQPPRVKTAIARALRREVWPLLESGKLRPALDRVFPLVERDAALDHMAANRNIGKIVLKVA